MRIAVVNWSRRVVGGVEHYLSAVLPALLDAGHDVSFMYEIDKPEARACIPLDGVETWCVADVGRESVLRALRDWAPDVIYAHGMLDHRLERELLLIAPVVFFAHSYYGTCISGRKTHIHPVTMPCARRFGPGCLVQFYPRRCGGLNPWTMARDYLRQGHRLEFLRDCALVVTHSDHMRTEYVRHGVNAVVVSYVGGHHADPGASAAAHTVLGAGDWDHDASVRAVGPLRLLCIGRMDPLKGGSTLIVALAGLPAALGRPVHLTFAGDGPARAKWERQARRLTARCDDLVIDFAGWVDGARREAIFESTDLLVVPSLWPEPFGLVGTEAGSRGVPVVAFDVGGVREWLRPGVNGAVAPGDPPTASGLAAAIVGCAADPVVLARLRGGARAVAAAFSMTHHLANLHVELERVRHAPRQAADDEVHGMARR